MSSCNHCCSGDPCGDDLVVLLSEKAAKEIHKKWLDTLQVCTRIIVIYYVTSCDLSHCDTIKCDCRTFKQEL